jgi:hypothetical protein
MNKNLRVGAILVAVFAAIWLLMLASIIAALIIQ